LKNLHRLARLVRARASEPRRRESRPAATRRAAFALRGCPRMVKLGRAIVAGAGAKMLTGSIIGFLIVFALLYWLLGGF
jgi:hypothetical protein